jgi:hypothetical protein
MMGQVDCCKEIKGGKDIRDLRESETLEGMSVALVVNGVEDKAV